jgi:hypothetical protein
LLDDILRVVVNKKFARFLTVMPLRTFSFTHMAVTENVILPLFYHIVQMKINLYVGNITGKSADSVLTDYINFVREYAKESQQVILYLQRSFIFWDFTQRIVLNSLQTFRDNLWAPSWIFLTFEYGTDTLSGNVGKKCHYTLRSIPEDRRAHLLRGESLKTRTLPYSGKEFPLQALTGPEGSRSLRFPNLKTIGT